MCGVQLDWTFAIDIVQFRGFVFCFILFLIEPIQLIPVRNYRSRRTPWFCPINEPKGPPGKMPIIDLIGMNCFYAVFSLVFVHTSPYLLHIHTVTDILDGNDLWYTNMSFVKIHKNMFTFHFLIIVIISYLIHFNIHKCISFSCTMISTSNIATSFSLKGNNVIEWRIDIRLS